MFEKPDNTTLGRPLHQVKKLLEKFNYRWAAFIFGNLVPMNASAFDRL